MPPKKTTAAASKASRSVKNLKSKATEKAEVSAEPSTTTTTQATKRKHEEDEDDNEEAAQTESSTNPSSSLSDRMTKLKELKKRRVMYQHEVQV